MKNRRILALLLMGLMLMQVSVATVAVLAQQKSNDDLSRQTLGKYLVTIYVMDLSGEPIDKAMVQIYQGSVLLNETATNPLGKCTVNLNTGIYDIVVKKHGYKDGYYESNVVSNMAVKIYLEVGTGSLEDGTSLIYYLFAVIGTFATVSSVVIGYSAFKYQKKHHPSKVLEKILEEKK